MESCLSRRQGYEKLQNVLETVELETETLQNAGDWCEQMVVVRFMELMRTAHLTTRKQNLKWAAIPLYFTEHSYDFIVQSEVK